MNDYTTLGISKNFEYSKSKGVMLKEDQRKLYKVNHTQKSDTSSIYIKHKIWQTKQVVFSLQPEIYLDSRLYPSDYSLRWLVGINFDNFIKKKAFLNFEQSVTFPRSQKKRFMNELSFGISTFKQNLLLTQIFFNFSSQELKKSLRDVHLQIQTSTVEKITNNIYLQLGYSYSLGGKNFLQQGMVISLWIDL